MCWTAPSSWLAVVTLWSMAAIALSWGGKKKGFKQIAGVEHAYVVADDLETGFNSKRSLWLFGFFVPSGLPGAG